MFETLTINTLIAKIDSEDILARAERKGIVSDHPALAFLESVLCEIEKPNLNKFRLAEDATKEALPTLIGCQINFNHVRKGAICGFIYDAWINSKKQVMIDCVFFKHIYKAEYIHAKKLFKNNELTMSLELAHDQSTEEKLSDGTRRINDFYFTGAGLLMGEEPACPNAIVSEFAKKIEENRQELLFASKRNLDNANYRKQKEIVQILSSFIKGLKINKDALEQSEEGGKNIVNLEEIKAKLSEELGDLVKDWTDEDFQNEEKIAEARKVKEDLTKQASTEEQAQQTTIEQERKEKITETIDDEKKSDTIKSEIEIIVKRDGQVIRTEKSDTEVVYLYAQVEEIKADYEKQITELKAQVESKDKEIDQIRINADKIANLKIEYANNDFVKEFKDEDWLNEQKLNEAKTMQANKALLEKNKEELKDNEFAKDFSDEDYLNADKVANVKLQLKIKTLEASQNKQEIQAVKKDDLETGHNEDVKNRNIHPINKVMKSRK